MRPSHLLVVAGVILQLAACSSTSTGTGTSGGTSGGGAASSGASGGGTGTCASSCEYYLRCKAADTPDNRALCTQRCVAQGFTAQQLGEFERMDCPRAVAAIEGSSSSSSSGSSSCTGCVWDGSSCIYLTGSGGNYFPCDRSCCP